jgi:polysaccharide biosynthesis protein PslA
MRGAMSIVGPRPQALGTRANNKFFGEVDPQYGRPTGLPVFGRLGHGKAAGHPAIARTASARRPTAP